MLYANDAAEDGLVGLFAVLFFALIVIVVAGRYMNQQDHKKDAREKAPVKSELPKELMRSASHRSRAAYDAVDDMPRSGKVYELDPVTNTVRGKGHTVYNGSTRNNSFTVRDNKIWVYASTGRALDGSYYPVQAFLLGFNPYKTDKYWLPLAVMSQRLRYGSDTNFLNGKYDDVWQTSKQTYYHFGGDCEDHAILLADWLIENGFDARVALGEDSGASHAWVILYLDDTAYLLEATKKISCRTNYPLASAHPEYSARFMFDQSRFWARVKGPVTDYSDECWTETGRFKEMINVK